MRMVATTLVLLASCVLATNGCGGSGDASASPYVLIQGEQVIAVGQTTRLFADTLRASDATYTWTSDDPLFASVDAEGLVTGVAPGETIIRVRGDGTGLEAACGIQVVPGPGEGIPFYEAWRLSAHGNADAAAFHVWDAVGEVPADCARCHSTYGFRDWIGDDGSPAGVVDAAPPTGSTVECTACHGTAAAAIETVVFPSGVELEGLDRDALCMQCHGGRTSTDTVDLAIAAADVMDDDTSSKDLWPRTPHYMGAGATMVGGMARGGYQYAGKRYDARFAHVGMLSSCTDCHDPHSLEVSYLFCASCHLDATDAAAVRQIRMQSSIAHDYDGDGDLDEGIAAEIGTLAALLEDVLRAYADQVIGSKLAIGSNPAPNFFVDLDGDGTLDPEEATTANQYTQWTARLTRAATNLLFARNDRGAHVHNAKYVIQLLHDAILDLNQALASPLVLPPLVRDDPGHFDGSSEAARHWDGDGEVRASCARCHSASAGFVAYVESGENLDAQPVANGLDCETCHPYGGSPLVRRMDGVDFPGDYRYEDAGNASLLCMTCHTGRESKATIDDAIAAADLSFKNVHYLPAAGVLLGSEAALGYEYDGHAYAGAKSHAGGADCLDCHGAEVTNHTFDVEIGFSACSACHLVASVGAIRMSHTADYDGDGSTTEPLAGEIDTLAADLLVEIQTVATAAGTPIAYDAHAYPYFFKDTNANGVADPGEAIYPNKFAAWTPALMKAAHNYQISRKEPAAWAHNFAYVVQLLIDAIEDLGGDVGDYQRPTDS